MLQVRRQVPQPVRYHQVLQEGLERPLKGLVVRLTQGLAAVVLGPKGLVMTLRASSGMMWQAAEGVVVVLTRRAHQGCGEFWWGCGP